MTGGVLGLSGVCGGGEEGGVADRMCGFVGSGSALSDAISALTRSVFENDSSCMMAAAHAEGSAYAPVFLDLMMQSTVSLMGSRGLDTDSILSSAMVFSIRVCGLVRKVRQKDPNVVPNINTIQDRVAQDRT